MGDASKLTTLLKDNGYSVTKPRNQVYDALQAIDEPIATAQLVEYMQGVDKVSIYRTIELFEKIGIVHRIWNGFKSQIELSEAMHHHHHFTCINCGVVISLQNQKLEEQLHVFEAEYNFELKNHSIELTGYCQSCRSKPN